MRGGGQEEHMEWASLGPQVLLVVDVTGRDQLTGHTAVGVHLHWCQHCSHGVNRCARGRQGNPLRDEQQ